MDIFVFPIFCFHSKVAAHRRERKREREIASSPAESTGESSRLRGATYWTKLAHIKQGSNWNSDGIRGFPASRLRARSRFRWKWCPRGSKPGSEAKPSTAHPLFLSRSPRLRASSPSPLRPPFPRRRRRSE